MSFVGIASILLNLSRNVHFHLFVLKNPFSLLRQRIAYVEVHSEKSLFPSPSENRPRESSVLALAPFRGNLFPFFKNGRGRNSYVFEKKEEEKGNIRPQLVVPDFEKASGAAGYRKVVNRKRTAQRAVRGGVSTSPQKNIYVKKLISRPQGMVSRFERTSGAMD